MCYLKKFVKLSLVLIFVSTFIYASEQVSPGQKYVDSGIEFLKAGKFEEAIEEFSKAIEVDPKLAKAYSNRAIAYEAESKIQYALKDISMAIDLEPDRASYYYNRALLEGRIGGKADRSEIILDVDKALKLNPTNIIYILLRGSESLRQLRFMKTCSELPNCREKYNIDEDSLALAEKEALAYYDKALKLDPEHPKANTLFGSFWYAKVKDIEEDNSAAQGEVFKKAIRYYDKALLSSKIEIEDKMIAANSLANIYVELGNKEKAKDYLDLIVDEEGRGTCEYTTGSAFTLRISLALYDEDWEKAREIYGKLLRNKCYSYDEEDQSQFFDELLPLSKRIAKERDNVSLYLKRAELAYSIYLSSLSRMDVETAYKLAPDKPKVLYYYARYSSSLKNTSKSIKFLTKAIELDSNYADAYLFRIQCYYQLFTSNEGNNIELEKIILEDSEKLVTLYKQGFKAEERWILYTFKDVVRIYIGRYEFSKALNFYEVMLSFVSSDSFRTSASFDDERELKAKERLINDIKYHIELLKTVIDLKKKADESSKGSYEYNLYNLRIMSLLLNEFYAFDKEEFFNRSYFFIDTVLEKEAKNKEALIFKMLLGLKIFKSENSYYTRIDSDEMREEYKELRDGINELIECFPEEEYLYLMRARHIWEFACYFDPAYQTNGKSILEGVLRDLEFYVSKKGYDIDRDFKELISDIQDTVLYLFFREYLNNRR